MIRKIFDYICVIIQLNTMQSIVYAQIAAEKMRDKPRKLFIQRLQQFLSQDKPSFESWKMTALISDVSYAIHKKVSGAIDIISYAAGEIHIVDGGNVYAVTSDGAKKYNSLQDAELNLYYSLTTKTK